MNQADFQAKVLEHMGSTDAKLENISGWMGKLDGEVAGLRADGCSTGKRNSERIKVLEDAPKKGLVGASLAGTGAGAFVYGLITAIKGLIGK